MESISNPMDKTKASGDDQNGLPLPHQRKRSVTMNVIKMALYMLRLNSNRTKSKSVHVNVISKLSWKRLLGSMRPMHLQSNRPPSPTFGAKPGVMVKPELEFVSVGSQQTEEGFAIASFGSVGYMSQLYESPSNQEIHVMEPNDEENWFDDCGGDEMIDAKAEEFIAHFYEQMRLQNLMNQ